MFNILAQADYNYSYDPSADAANQAAAGAALGFSMIVMLFALVIGLISIIGLWKVFQKAGRPGWQSIVPFYNLWVLFEISGKPGYWMLSFLVSPLMLVLSAIASIELAKRFGKDTVFGIVALWLFSPIGYLILGFGKDQYKAAEATASPTSTATPAQPAATPPASTPTAPTPPAATPVA